MLEVFKIYQSNLSKLNFWVKYREEKSTKERSKSNNEDLSRFLPEIRLQHTREKRRKARNVVLITAGRAITKLLLRLMLIIR